VPFPERGIVGDRPGASTHEVRPGDREGVFKQHRLARWLAEERPSLEDIAATACSFVEQAVTPALALEEDVPRHSVGL
jgi:hypothetical protein